MHASAGLCRVVSDREDSVARIGWTGFGEGDMEKPRIRGLSCRLGPVVLGAYAITLIAYCPLSGQEPSKDPSEIDNFADNSASTEISEGYWAKPVAFKQPQPSRVPQRQVISDVPAPQSTATGRLSQRNINLPSSLLTQGIREPGMGPATESVASGEAQSRASTDTGSLIGRSPSLLGVGVQRRTPIVNDPRVRGSRVGQLAGAGSYWIPARIDLDTAVNKLDSHVIEDVTVIKGPYSALYGPGWNFLVVDLLDSPRFEYGPEIHSSTEAVYHTNGQQLLGRETLWGGDQTSGYRANYVHRIGNDYESGDGTAFTSSYNMRELDLALGHTFAYGGYVEFNYLRLDQTGVEFPGQAFDIDFLVTDGFEVEMGLVEEQYFDKLALELWYNRTRFEGVQGPNKRIQFPLLDDIDYTGFTDVDAASIGYRLSCIWGDPTEDSFTIGTDLRLIKQDLEEIASGDLGLGTFVDTNSPIPKSYSVDPGVFLERFIAFEEYWRVRIGARASWTTTNIVEDPAELAAVGNYPAGIQPSYADIVGTDEFNQNFKNVTGFVTSEYDLDDQWTLLGGIGAARRPPSLTELYAAQPFMFLIQNGLNTVTGDPRLKPETIAQVDLGITCQTERFWGGLSGYHAWGIDYITFENIAEVAGPPLGDTAQTNLKYVNTDLATFTGFEAFLQYKATDWLTPFAVVSYVDGRDRTRNGDFATTQVQPGVPSMRVAGNRGSAGGNFGIDRSQEPLPGILPMDARIGIRLHPYSEQAPWGYELSARVVSTQNRVAESLNETDTIGFTVWDMRGYWQARPGVLLLGGIENFTDNNYREHLDFRSTSGFVLFQPGVNFYFGSELTF